MKSLRVVLGTMTFGGQTSKQDATSMLERFVAAGHAEIDTARMYEHGATERMLGEIFAERGDLRDALKTATKANAFKGYDERLDAASVDRQMASTAEALRNAPVDIYYLHNPDGATPILETLAAVDALHKKGAFAELGLSNFAAWEVAHVHHLCEKNGYVKPTVYQGMYNAITRDVERELLPCLRALGMRFYAYNPLAGGLLACSRGRDVLTAPLDDGSRFRSSNAMYRERYLNDVQLEAVDEFKDACEEAGARPARAALQWLRTDSALESGDAIIIGASSLSHFDDNLAAFADDAPLPAGIAAACDAGWRRVKESGVCPSYERGTSKYA